MRLRLVAYEATARQIFPRWEYFLPRLGMFCSQGGNFLLSVCLSMSKIAQAVGELCSGARPLGRFALQRMADVEVALQHVEVEFWNLGDV